jgi:uncharacterized small protein (DUF1192 family)
VSGYLLDTNVISMLSPARPEASAAFLDWLERMDAGGRLFLSVVTIHEIEKGIALLEHKGARAKAARLKVWLAGLVATYDDKIIAVDTMPPHWPDDLKPGRLLPDTIPEWPMPRSPALRKPTMSPS